MSMKTCALESAPAIELAGAMELMAWCQTFGVSRTTAWNWRRSGRLKVIYRYGRAYVPAEEIRRLSR
ncbi:MAG TPA: helix-turn-helix domain-containing protein, partial [Terriglobales bacterium]